MKRNRLSKWIAVITVLALSVSILTLLAACGDTYNYELLIREGNSIESVYALYKQEYPNASIDDFVDRYIAYESEPGEFAANRALRSAVSIRCSFSYTYTGTFGREQSGTASAAGAGVLYSVNADTGEAYIITNYHVVYQVITNSNNQILAHGLSNTITVYTYGREFGDYGISAEFVGGSMDEDIAVLKAKDKIFKSDFFEALIWTDEGVAQDKIEEGEVKVGERAIACGNPEGGGISVTSGIISVASEEITMYKLTDYKKTVTSRVLRVDTAINPGNSGGALYNRSGRFIGLVNAKSGDTNIENIGFAIPASVAIGIAKNVIETNGGLRFTLGIAAKREDMTILWENDAAVIFEVIVVGEVTEDMPAYEKLFKGDILLGAKLLNAAPIEISRSYQLREYLFNARPGDTLELSVARNGETITVTVELTKYTGFND